jgi:photosystem II oxygen-evolving enhancer protein 3
VLGFLAGAAALTISPQSQAYDFSGIAIKDERAQRDNGFDIIYEARDLDLDQDTRDGLAQARKNLDATKTRVKESESRIDNLDELISKNYW